MAMLTKTPFVTPRAIKAHELLDCVAYFIDIMTVNFNDI